MVGVTCVINVFTFYPDGNDSLIKIMSRDGVKQSYYKVLQINRW